MKDEFNIDIESLDKEEGSKFDMRQYEMELFSQMYTQLLRFYMVYTNDRQQHEVGRRFFSLSKTMISSFKKYARHDEDLYDDLEWLEAELTKLKNTCCEIEKPNPNGPGTITVVNKVEVEAVDEVKAYIERMREAGNLKMPKKSSTNEDRAWEKGK